MQYAYLDTDVEYAVPLEIIGVQSEAWNGFPVPVATAEAVRAFVAQWRDVDPNGTWGEVIIREDGSLWITRNDDPTDECDIWPPVREGWSPYNGEAYALAGWTWIVEESG